jgi:hypothetical protein
MQPVNPNGVSSRFVVDPSARLDRVLRYKKQKLPLPLPLPLKKPLPPKAARACPSIFITTLTTRRLRWLRNRNSNYPVG